MESKVVFDTINLFRQKAGLKKKKKARIERKLLNKLKREFFKQANAEEQISDCEVQNADCDREDSEK